MINLHVAGSECFHDSLPKWCLDVACPAGARKVWAADEEKGHFFYVLFRRTSPATSDWDSPSLFGSLACTEMEISNLLLHRTSGAPDSLHDTPSFRGAELAND
jgi:hypothetical protein